MPVISAACNICIFLRRWIALASRQLQRVQKARDKCPKSEKRAKRNHVRVHALLEKMKKENLTQYEEYMKKYEEME